MTKVEILIHCFAFSHNLCMIPLFIFSYGPMGNLSNTNFSYIKCVSFAYFLSFFGFLLDLIAMTEKCLSFFTISFKLYIYIKVIYHTLKLYIYTSRFVQSIKVIYFHKLFDDFNRSLLKIIINQYRW